MSGGGGRGSGSLEPEASCLEAALGEECHDAWRSDADGATVMLKD